MGCCDSIIKCMFIIFNVIFALGGLALIVIGCVFMYQTSRFQDILTDIQSGLLIPEVIIIVIGAIIFITSSLGFCGALRGSRWKLITFATILSLVLLIQVCLAVYVAINVGKVKTTVENEMMRYFKTIKNSTDHEKLFQEVERKLECCGVSGPGDYITIQKSIPESCCIKSGCEDTGRGKYHMKGCSKTVTDISSLSETIIVALGVVLAILEGIGVALAVRLTYMI